MKADVDHQPFLKGLNMDYRKVLDQAVAWVDQVATYQLEAITNRNFRVETKATDVDMVTDIDHRSEAMLLEKIHQAYPDHNILGEESGVKSGKVDYTWVIDPIDGTTNFVHGYPMHCISLALKKGNETVVGIVKAPVLGYLFTAIRGEGAYFNHKKMTVSQVDQLNKSLLATGFPYSRKTDNMNLPYFNKIVNNIAGIRRGGSAALDLCMVAAGMLDGYWEFAVNEWDVAAGVLFVEEAGGFTRFEVYKGHNLIIAANEQLMKEMETHLEIE